MATASADLGKLASFVAAADGILNGGDSGSLGLNQRIASLRANYDTFQTLGWVSNPDLMGYGPGGGEIAGLATHYRNDRLFVEAVRRAFETASGSGRGVVTVDEMAFNTAFATAVADVARENGIDPAELLMRRAPVTVDGPWAAGVPQSSGFVNDPICTATGHFLEVEEDFTWPERLAVLRWRRVYSSRFVAEGPFGRGWASWATVGCVRYDDGTVGFQGSDASWRCSARSRRGLGTSGCRVWRRCCRRSRPGTARTVVLAVSVAGGSSVGTGIRRIRVRCGASMPRAGWSRCLAPPQARAGSNTPAAAWSA